MNITYNLNEELNGIELFFSAKPQKEVLSNLKENGFRWSNFKKCWYTKQSEKAFQVVNSLVSGEVKETKEEKNKQNKLHTRKNKQVKTLSLWEAAQWNGMEVNTDQEAKVIAKEIRAHIKKRFPQCKFSVTVPYYGKINFTIKSSPFEKGSVYLNAVKEYCVNLLNAYRHCYSPSDPYTDYAGSYNFYGYVEIDWEYTQTAATEEVEKDMKEFDVKFVEAEEAAEEKRKQEFQAYMEQREAEQREYEKQQAEEKKQVETIYNNVEVKELDETNQYFITGSEFANLNKNETLDQYKEEVQNGDYSLENVKVTKEVHFSSQEALVNFSNMLLNDFDFLANTGGSFTEDNRINSMTDFYNMDELEKQTVQWNLYGVAIYLDGQLQFIVDAQGHSYARYVGLTDNAKVEKTIVFNQVVTDEEKEELTHQADVLEDISTEVICELNIMDTWQNESWKEYKEAMKVKFKESNFSFTKRVIQQLELEELKVSMYKLLQDVDSIQDQFEEADLSTGDKVTLFYISDWGSIVTSRVTLDEVANEKYAQYDNAVKLTFTPEKKRKLHYKHFYSELLVYKGWLNLPDTVLHHVEETNNMKVTRSKYHSCDHRQYDEILNYFDQQGIEPIVNTYKPKF
ncbi:hypothetical protein BEH_07375 [Priestia filamentosa]|uniref:Large polyvalent protein associated domain-containing protein n=1 Tax=Priestia filamentosa TaxID=1402861 RepID=A0A0H4KGK3_9BACI|nr:LPD29 domain-containing protein [Priestia filamentosa]AKO91936.1 hypothetical protein BEH_07375 [Priestia filamentosa]